MEDHSWLLPTVEGTSLQSPDVDSEATAVEDYNPGEGEDYDHDKRKQENARGE